MRICLYLYGCREHFSLPCMKLRSGLQRSCCKICSTWLSTWHGIPCEEPSEEARSAIQCVSFAHPTRPNNVLVEHQSSELKLRNSTHIS